MMQTETPKPWEPPFEFEGWQGKNSNLWGKGKKKKTRKENTDSYSAKCNIFKSLT